MSLQEKLAELEKRNQEALVAGGQDRIDKHHAAGKLTARERIEALIDPGTAFLELSTLAAWEMYDGQAPGAGVVTGIGVISGHDCMIVANDATVKGGTYYPVTVKKHLRAQEIAQTLPAGVDGAAVLCAVVRELLVDGDDGQLCALDAAIRDACVRHPLQATDAHHVDTIVRECLRMVEGDARATEAA
jgi:hypothetical protein